LKTGLMLIWMPREGFLRKDIAKSSDGERENVPTLLPRRNVYE
jgi:hypothetical protein